METVKLFYSQGYTTVYDEGNRLDIQLLYPSQTRDFHVYNLEKLKEEHAFLEQCGYNLNHYFKLEDIHIYRNELGLFSNPRSSKNLEQSYNFYLENVSKADWGCITAFGVTIECKDTLAIRVTTDGDDGWLEVFDRKGTNLGAARTNSSAIAWRSRSWIRENFPAYPPEIAPENFRKKK